MHPKSHQLSNFALQAANSPKIFTSSLHMPGQPCPLLFFIPPFFLVLQTAASKFSISDAVARRNPPGACVRAKRLPTFLSGQFQASFPSEAPSRRGHFKQANPKTSKSRNEKLTINFGCRRLPGRSASAAFAHDASGAQTAMLVGNVGPRRSTAGLLLSQATVSEGVVENGMLQKAGCA